MRTPLFAALALPAAILMGCSDADIGDLAGCYEIDDAPAFRLGRDYRVIVDGRAIAQMRMEDTDAGPRFISRPSLIARRSENGFTIGRGPNTPELVGAVEKTMFGAVYLTFPTDGGEEALIEAYHAVGTEC